MASWHLFKQSWFQTFMIRRLGAFSVLREGNDRKSLETAIDILVDGKRPLIMFPEGAITKHNDIINEMMDGPSFMARQAAKRLKKMRQLARSGDSSGGDSLFVRRRPGNSDHPDARRARSPALLAAAASICRCSSGSASWATRFSSLKEIEYLGAAQSGNPYDRAEHFIDTVLDRVEDATGSRRTVGRRGRPREAAADG